VAEHWAWLQFNNTLDQEKELEQITQQMAAFGASEKDIAAFVYNQKKRQTGIESDCVIWLENQITANIFLQLSTQWHIQPMTGQRVNLNWQSAEIAIRNKPELVDKTPMEHAQIFEQIQAMEHAAIVVLREQQRRQNNE